ncbi:MAG TPA: SMC-Scp complex subunit ScpB [Oscillatoriaceae cyanobacterium M33_DOE_052]|uniref:SMC-Scp complex subunit ScpB n=1 Tax=Planktothricoides sp. SpSt-374 TaxID=2282167 RepID=A0A7C3ZJS2_9CYAN|nr:SMC-Scp complex subunit ScpB [Oscillatoriaceae cyanobacterium M33_DOE_052]
MSRLVNIIEAILYLKGEPLSIADLAEYAGCNRDEAEAATIELMDDYARRDSSLEVVETQKGYSLQLRETYHELVHQLIPAELSLAALRTLAAIALYPGQISQSELVEIRGSGAYQHVQELLQQDFIRKRRQSDGRSYWLQLTKKFHQYFQIDQLPQQLKLNFQTTPEEVPEQDGETG